MFVKTVSVAVIWDIGANRKPWSSIGANVAALRIQIVTQLKTSKFVSAQEEIQLALSLKVETLGTTVY
ncbi:hypothetical protein L1987_81264 [Smallanthus sonchifolius]|uniref:Uncharacterized protein n=1 Tax=Smallanthus sonchifolius TaxID=185202 RepID=A0ACB8YRK4_9ASTR|nr:hypothetical protein L1987_81264 [Smallanthus sonchifolius]